MNNPNISSEEKLLKLIRKKGDKPSGKKEKKKDPKRQKQKTSSTDSAVGADSLKLINRLLVIIVVAIFGYVVVKNFVLPKEQTDSGVVSARKARVEKTEPDVLMTEIRPFEEIQAVLDQRNLFKSPWEKTDEPEAQQEETTSSLSDLKLIGLVLDSDPRAIIEDKRSGEVKFMSVGEEISGAVLTEIFDTKAVFSLNDEKIELIQQ